MKTSTIMYLAVVLSLIATSAMADPYVVDIGTVASEAGYNLVGWGPVEPTTHGGTWGGIASDPLSFDGLCRVVWEGAADPTTTGKSASLTFANPVSSVSIRHLVGFADDGFQLNVYGGGELWGTVVDSTSATEVWMTSTLSGTPGKTVTLTATGAPWTSFDPYGQVAIDRIEAVPVPGAVLLGVLGLSAAGMKLRRRNA